MPPCQAPDRLFLPFTDTKKRKKGKEKEKCDESPGFCDERKPGLRVNCLYLQHEELCAVDDASAHVLMRAGAAGLRAAFRCGWSVEGTFIRKVERRMMMGTRE